MPPTADLPVAATLSGRAWMWGADPVHYVAAGLHETIELTTAGACTRALSPDLAAAEYIPMLRNATHGHDSNKPRRVELTNTLLAHHDGTLPHNLALLGYLHLLDVLAHPDVLRKRLYGGGNG